MLLSARSITPSSSPTKPTKEHTIYPDSFKKDSGVPRLPSILMGTRASTASSAHSFTFDDEHDNSFNLALQYMEAPVHEVNLLPLDKESTKPEASELKMKELLKPQDTLPIETAFNRSLAKSKVPTEINGDPHKVRAIASVLSVSTSSKEHAQQRSSSFAALEKELERYKALYKDALEENEMTLELANEEILTLRDSYSNFTLEKTALDQLHQAKAEVAKLKNELVALKEENRQLRQKRLAHKT
jgi:hypothetical protein